MALRTAAGRGSVTSPIPHRMMLFAGTGILRRVGVYSSRNFRKKIAGFEFKIMIVEECHALTPIGGRKTNSVTLAQGSNEITNRRSAATFLALRLWSQDDH